MYRGLLLLVGLVGPAASVGTLRSKSKAKALFAVDADDVPPMRFHRCQWSGRPDRLEDYLTSAQMVDPQNYYYGRARYENYFQHLFVERECTNGLPKGPCFSGLRQAWHCGPDEDWAVISPDEQDGPGVMWRNQFGCLPNEGRDPAANITVDYLCFDRQTQTRLHRCVLETNPAAGGVRLDGIREGEEEAALKLLQTPGQPGQYQHFWNAAECSNGLPPKDAPCQTSVRWGEHCTGDHDWRSTIDGAGNRGVAWFTSHSCTCARVAVDYFCPYNEPDKWKFHRCHFSGASDVVDDFLCERQHVMQGLADSDRNILQKADGRHLVYRQDQGTCRQHVFKPSECLGGLPAAGADCVASFVHAQECGREQDWGIHGGDGSKTPLSVRWFNGAPAGPCSTATVVIDLLCRKK